jgi:hypothetical protein
MLNNIFNTAFQVTPNEFFLLLGPDGSSLRELAGNYEIVIKGVRRNINDSFTLVVDGHGYELERFANIVAERKRVCVRLLRMKQILIIYCS